MEDYVKRMRSAQHLFVFCPEVTDEGARIRVEVGNFVWWSLVVKQITGEGLKALHTNFFEASGLIGSLYDCERSCRRTLWYVYEFRYQASPCKEIESINASVICTAAFARGNLDI